MNDTPAPLPTDEPTSEELAAAGTIRPLDQLPSPWEVKGNPKMISQPTLKALSPADQQSVRERATGTGEDAVQAALMAFLHERSIEARIKSGAGAGATEPEREALSQMNQVRLLTEEHNRVVAELDDISEHRTEYDAEGNATPVPVHVHQGDGRKARQTRLTEIKHQMALLYGHEGQKALEVATRNEALKVREINQQLTDRREIERRAHEMERDARINQAADRKAKFLKGNLG